MGKNDQSGFTLIELSIVLVIIGLIVGAILIGQDLIEAAQVRAQISQIEKYNTAVNTFRVKYDALPGDMDLATATNTGFVVGTSCDGTQGKRDGNGLIDGYSAPWIDAEAMGETGLFWQDLSTAGLISDAISGITCVTWPNVSGSALNTYFPAAKIGAGNYVYVFDFSGSNWFGLSAITSVAGGGAVQSATTLSVSQAYNIDSKIDDGLPMSGSVQAMSLYGFDNQQPEYVYSGDTAATPSDTATTCFANNWNNLPNLPSQHYSTSIDNGAGRNCSLSFRFQ